MKNTMRSARVSWAGMGIFLILFSGCGGGSGGGSSDVVAPTAPAGVQAAAVSSNAIALSWNAASDNVGIATYEIYSWDVSVVTVPSTTTMFLYAGLAPATQYCCTVKAIDAAGNESAPSAPPACATTAPLLAPSGLNGGGSQNKIGLSWTVSAYAASYKVYRDGVLLVSVPTATFLDTGLNTSTQYCYTVSSVDSIGNESPPCAPACITTLPPLTDITIPAVLSTLPLNNAVEVQTDPLTISAIFSEAMSPLSMMTHANFILRSESGQVSGDHFYDAATFEFTFVPWTGLVSGTTYTATIKGDVEDVAMNKMGIDHVWTFTTATSPVITLPKVLSTNPTTDESNVPVDTVITVVFSEQMAPLTLTHPDNASNFTVSGPGGDVPGRVTYDAEIATFTPNAPLAYNTRYDCKILKNVTDQAGHMMDKDYTWSFTTP